MDYTVLDDFSTENLVLEEGQKANGYQVLTNEAKVVNQAFLKGQIDTIDAVMANNYDKDWNAVVKQITENYSGISKITKSTENSLLLDSIGFMGEDTNTLNAEKSQYEGLNDGKARTISLGDLGMAGSGYVYGEVTDQEKLVSEKALPYITGDFLNVAKKMDHQPKSALKVINNDHIYVAFSVPKDVSLEGEETALKYKEKNMGTRDSSKNTAYYSMLVERVDLVRDFPQLFFNYQENTYSGYLVDSIEDGDSKIIVMMIKDYINVFSNQINTESNVYLERFESYQIPQSAIVRQGDKTYVKMIEKGYFEELLEVFVRKYENGKAILAVDDNPDLSSGISIKTYP